ncbi:hypothetical protein CH286_25540 [Rhodococcus sp. WWJCD1]|uniref:WhiB family transcriptional regulator n=1 Tax=unclassified Rhodococcus (in: high G+C Gram-positive bacteria) TaxID=192944 RepID=UPI000B9B4E29|nr:hypothetical protein CH286_25540 [Rhodococcus sp. WWJCD1]OZE89377.1 hypothetical protein CH302_28060 [Rhodococcus sp. 15-2388-1-1a]
MTDRARIAKYAATPPVLPPARTEEWEWQLLGRCRGTSSATFFAPNGLRGRSRTEREQEAKEICAQCPVVSRCREYALQAGEPYGVWGGLTATERARLTHRASSQRSDDDIRYSG